MHFDALTLAATAAELEKTLVGGRVQQVILPDGFSVGMEVYRDRQRHYLLLSAHAQASRVLWSDQKLRRGVEKETPMLQLLRKYVRGAILEQVGLPVPFERVLQLHFEHREHGSSILVAEPMGRLSNLLLLDGGSMIRGVLTPVPAGENAERVLLPRRAYAFPPPQGKVPPLPDGSDNYPERLKLALQSETRLWKGLIGGVDGISPTLAREIAWRALGDENAAFDATQMDAILGALGDLWTLPQRGAWSPGIVLDDAGNVAAFAPYELHFGGDWVAMESVSAAVMAFYGEKERDAAASKDAYASIRNGVATLLRDATSRIERQFAALAADEPAPGEPALIRTQAEWLLALSSQIKPGQQTLVIPLGDDEMHIALDPRFSAVEQAERLFDRAAKLERAAEIIPVRRQALEVDLSFVQQLGSDLALAENQPEIVAVREELRAAGYLRTRTRHRGQSTPARAKPLRFLSPDGFTILVGRNARQNENITFDEANAEDLWLHIRDRPGAHVVIRNGGQTVGGDTIEAAAQLAAYFSSQRGEGAVAVAVTQRRFVTRMAGGHPGQVHYRNETTVTVPAHMPAL